MMKRLKYLTLAALVAFAACDEGGTTAPPEPAVGTVSGSVTAEGEGVAGVTVTLVGESSQSVTTGANGSFSFTNVVEGNYVVSISSIPSDYVFPTTSQTASITQDGQTVQVSFSGQIVRTASIAGQVTAGGTGVEGVTVTINGPEGTEDRVTGSAGNYSFTGLRSGDYTVEINNPDPDVFAFPTTSQSVSLESGESEVVNFSGTRTLPGSISGIVSASGEGVEGATVSIAGPENASKVTAADGSYQFTNLTPGTYVVTLTNPDEEQYIFETLEQTVELASDEAEVVNFGGTIIAEPEVSIEAITQGGEPVDPDSIAGRVEINVNVDRNGAELAAVQLLVTDGENVYLIDEQTFATGAPLLQDDENDEEDVTFSWNSDLIRRVDGSRSTIGVGDSPAGPFEPIAADAMRPYHPVFLNGDWQIWARVIPAEGSDADPVNAIRNVTLVNEDAVNLGVMADNDDWINPFGTEGDQNYPFFPEFIIDDDTGLRWLSGDIYITVYPIIYSAPFDPNNPLLQRASFAFDGFINGADFSFGGFELTEPEDDGTFVFTFCESPPTATAGGSCYDDIDQLNTGFIGARNLSLVTKTSFGQFGPTLDNLKSIRLFDTDLQSGTGVLNDVLRVDNEDPEGGDFDTLDHPANAIPGVSGFARSTAGGPTNLGWVNWNDVLSDLFNQGDSDAPWDVGAGGPFTGPGGQTLNTGDDLVGIGLPPADHVALYISGPDNALGTPSAIVNNFLDPANNDFGGIIGTLTGADLPPETDSPGLTDDCPDQGIDDVCSAEGTPFSDTETDYGLAGITWDEFGNFEPSTDADGAPYLQLGVDGRPPIFSNATGLEQQDPNDAPTDTDVTVWDSFDDDQHELSTVAATFGQETWPMDNKVPGAVQGYSTDRGNGFSGTAGVVVEDWENGCLDGISCTPADGGAPGFDTVEGTTSGFTRYGYTLQMGGFGATVVLPFTFDGEGMVTPPGNDTFDSDLPLYPTEEDFYAWVAMLDTPDFRDGYRQSRFWNWDRAGNFRIWPAPSGDEAIGITENIADHDGPNVGNVQMPTVVTYMLGTSYTFNGEAADQVDLRWTDFDFDFNSILSLQVYVDPIDDLPQEPSVDADGNPYESTSLQLPLLNVRHTDFGSSDILLQTMLTADVPFLGCLVRVDESGYASAASANTLGETGPAEPTWHRARGPRWRTWDHSYDYGLVNTQFNTFAFGTVPDCAVAPTSAGDGLNPAVGDVGTDPDGADDTFGTIDDEFGTLFLVIDDRPTLVLKGPAGSFVPSQEIIENVMLYYLDESGRARLLPQDQFSLIVSDVGTGDYGRWYEYTYTGPLPGEMGWPALIDTGAAPANGTVDGYFFVLPRGGAFAGHGLILDTTAN